MMQARATISQEKNVRGQRKIENCWAGQNRLILGYTTVASCELLRIPNEQLFNKNYRVCGFVVVTQIRAILSPLSSQWTRVSDRLLMDWLTTLATRLFAIKLRWSMPAKRP